MPPPYPARDVTGACSLPRRQRSRTPPTTSVTAELAHLLRRGGYLLDHIAEVMGRVRGAGGPEPLAASLEDWRRRLATRGRAMLTAAGRLADCFRVREPLEGTREA